MTPEHSLSCNLYACVDPNLLDDTGVLREQAAEEVQLIVAGSALSSTTYSLIIDDKDPAVLMATGTSPALTHLSEYLANIQAKDTKQRLFQVVTYAE